MRLFAVFLLILAVLCAFFYSVEQAVADWRWKTPRIKIHRVKPSCDTVQCSTRARMRSRLMHKRKVVRYNAKKAYEWRYWTGLYIPSCTWYGESGVGPQYARYRYTMPNSGGSGAYGKFQFMPSTYHSNAKYHDWSPLDQEIAARREYWKHGTSPWSNC